MGKAFNQKGVGNDMYCLVYHICIIESVHEPVKWVRSNLFPPMHGRASCKDGTKAESVLLDNLDNSAVCYTAGNSFPCDR